MPGRVFRLFYSAPGSFSAPIPERAFLMNDIRPQLVTFEGGEGAGKSTVIGAVLDLLSRRGISHISTREPGGTPFGEAIRELVLHDTSAPVVAEAELLAIFAARSQHLAHVIEPALQTGQWVVCDRFVDSSYAYQGGGRGINEYKIQALERLFVPRTPDLTIYLDVPPAQGLARLAGRSTTPDRFESESATFFDAVRAAYLARAALAPGRIRSVDGRPAAEIVARQVVALVETHIAGVSHGFAA